MSAILKFDIQERDQLRFSEVNYLNYTEKPNFASGNFLFPKTRGNKNKPWTHSTPLKFKNVIKYYQQKKNTREVNESILRARMHPTLRSLTRNVFGVQWYKNYAGALLLRLYLSFVNSDWLQHTRTVRALYESSVISAWCDKACRIVKRRRRRRRTKKKTSFSICFPISNCVFNPRFFFPTRLPVNLKLTRQSIVVWYHSIEKGPFFHWF